MFDLQDQITGRVVAAIRGTLAKAKLPQRYPTTSVEAYDLVVKSRRLPDQSLANNREAFQNFSRAAALDPEYPEAHWQMAVSQLLWWCLWDGDKEESQRTSLASAQRAITLAPDDATANEAMGFVHMKLNQSDEAQKYYLRAVEIDPNNATTHAALCDLYMNWGMAEEALSAITTAIRLNPYPPGWFFDHLGRAQLLARDFENAVTTLSRVETHGTFSGSFLTAALALVGRHEEAQKEKRAFMQRMPHWRISRWVANEFFKREQDSLFWVDIFRRAGLPD